MYLNAIQRDALKEGLENAFCLLGVPIAKQNQVIPVMLEIVKELPGRDSPMFPPSFFDFSRTLRILARQEGITPRKAMALALENPRVFFEIPGLFEPPAMKPVEDTSPEEPEEEDGIDENGKIITKVDLHDTNFTIDVARRKPHESHLPTPIPLTFLEIGSLITDHKIRTGKYFGNGSDGLPEGAFGWMVLAARLSALGLTPKAMVKHYEEHGGDMITPEQEAFFAKARAPRKHRRKIPEPCFG